MTLLDVSIVNVALPSIQAGLGVSPAELSWVVAGYTLAFGLALVPSGRLGDGFGRRRMFLVGLAMFTVASMVAGWRSPARGWSALGWRRVLRVGC
ncbi:MFS transporter [Streptomyces sp. NPDC054933]